MNDDDQNPKNESREENFVEVCTDLFSSNETKIRVRVHIIFNIV